MVALLMREMERSVMWLARRVHVNCELNNAKRYILDSYKIHNIF